MRQIKAISSGELLTQIRSGAPFDIASLGATWSVYRVDKSGKRRETLFSRQTRETADKLAAIKNRKNAFARYGHVYVVAEDDQ